MQIVLRRHATTAGNALRQYIGATDQPLCEQGIQMAQSLPKDETVSKVYTSSLIRTQQTAKLLYPQARVVPKEGLEEMSFGLFEGKTHEEMADCKEYQDWLDSHCEAPCPKGECKNDFIKRSVKAFCSIVEEALKTGEDQLYFVLHGGTIMAIMSEFARPEKPYFDWHVPNCGGFVCAWSGDRMTYKLCKD